MRSTARQITGRGKLAVDKTFADATSALDFFNDRVLDPGKFDPDPESPDLYLNFRLDLTTNDPGTRFTTQLLFGSVPEPETLPLLALGLVLLAARRRVARGPISPLKR